MKSAQEPTGPVSGGHIPQPGRVNLEVDVASAQVFPAVRGRQLASMGRRFCAAFVTWLLVALPATLFFGGVIATALGSAVPSWLAQLLTAGIFLSVVTLAAEVVGLALVGSTLGGWFFRVRHVNIFTGQHGGPSAVVKYLTHTLWLVITGGLGALVDLTAITERLQRTSVDHWFRIVALAPLGDTLKAANAAGLAAGQTSESDSDPVVAIDPDSPNAQLPEIPVDEAGLGASDSRSLRTSSDHGDDSPGGSGGPGSDEAELPSGGTSIPVTSSEDGGAGDGATGSAAQVSGASASQSVAGLVDLREGPTPTSEPRGSNPTGSHTSRSDSSSSPSDSSSQQDPQASLVSAAIGAAPTAVGAANGSSELNELSGVLVDDGYSASSREDYASAGDRNGPLTSYAAEQSSCHDRYAGDVSPVDASAGASLVQTQVSADVETAVSVAEAGFASMEDEASKTDSDVCLDENQTSVQETCDGVDVDSSASDELSSVHVESGQSSHQVIDLDSQVEGGDQSSPVEPAVDVIKPHGVAVLKVTDEDLDPAASPVETALSAAAAQDVPEQPVNSSIVAESITEPVDVPTATPLGATSTSSETGLESRPGNVRSSSDLADTATEKAVPGTSVEVSPSTESNESDAHHSSTLSGGAAAIERKPAVRLTNNSPKILPQGVDTENVRGSNGDSNGEVVPELTSEAGTIFETEESPSQLGQSQHGSKPAEVGPSSERNLPLRSVQVSPVDLQEKTPVDSHMTANVKEEATVVVSPDELAEAAQQQDAVITLDDGTALAVPAGVTLLGRNPAVNDEFANACVHTIKDLSYSVSKTHLALGYGDTFWIMDLGSTNGTFLLDDSGALRRLPANQRVEVTQGVKIKFGERTFSVTRS